MISLDLLLIPLFGATGAAVASTVAYTVYGLAMLTAVSRIEGSSLRHMLLLDRAEMAALRDAVVARLRRRR